MRRKMLVLDIDGTLTNSQKQITPRTLEALLRIQQKGHIVTLASGRPTAGLRMASSALQLERYGGYLLSYNGAHILHRKSGRVLFERVLPDETLSQMCAFAREEGIGLLTYRENTILTSFAHDPYMEQESRINALPILDVEDLVSYVQFPIYKCLLTAPPQRAAQLEAILVERYGQSLSIYRSEPYFIEVMPPEIDKALSLGRLLEAIDMPVSDAIACGDGFNDISMIRFAGTGVAMANAQEVVKREADFITRSNDEDGVVEVIEKFLEGD